MSTVASRLDLCVCGHPRALHSTEPAAMDAEVPGTFCGYSGPSPADPTRQGFCGCAGFSAEPHCDFCTSIPAPWTYPTREVRHDAQPRPWVSHADWAACESCAALIEAGDRRGLAMTVFDNPHLPRMTKRERRAAIAHMIEMQLATFWRARNGDRYRHVSTPPDGQHRANAQPM